MGDTALPRFMWETSKLSGFLAQQAVEQAHKRGDVTKKDKEFWKDQIFKKWNHGDYADYIGNKYSFKETVARADARIS